ncbi:hypothetical protein DSM02_395 [Leeuwenhoekiella polynyae]|uniref:Uncharacterized protein n=1 Tax=Leeuwenhoekiella polynyae TaxID=1550906 RepID=A0A4Q0PI67_9FLAO|nr:hypothetical protein DSM02_395 [Leeuwenhoekiella polynyae]|tara:strand:+ start:907 stop:1047 length:141 start_codon:yes stop_codon:yes gene_type:complete
MSDKNSKNRFEFSENYKSMMNDMLLKLEGGELEFTPISKVMVKYSG